MQVHCQYVISMGESQSGTCARKAGLTAAKSPCLRTWNVRAMFDTCTSNTTQVMRNTLYAAVLNYF